MSHVGSPTASSPILRQIVASEAMSMLLSDASGRVLDANESFLALVGYTRADVEQGRVSESALTPPDLAHLDRAAAEALRRDGRHAPYEKDLVRRDGARVPVLVSTSYLGGPEELSLKFIVDLTERRRTEEARRRSEELFSKAFGASPDALSVVGARGRLLEINESWTRLFGIPRSEALDRTPDELGIFASAAERDRLRERLQSEGSLRDVEVLMRRRDGSELTASISIEPTRIAGEAGFITILRDISGRKAFEMERARVEQAFRDSAATLAAIGEVAPDFLWVTDGAGETVYINRQWFDYTGQTLEELKKRGHISVIHSDDRERLNALASKAFREGTPFEGEFRYRRKDGEYRWFRSRSMPLRGPNGELLRRVGIAVDVTELKKLNADLREADQRKDEFLAMLAHELRNPLGPIRNAIHALRQSGPNDELLRRLRDMIDRQTAHMARLIDDLLDVSRITRGKIMLQRDLLSLNELVGTVAGDYRNAFESNEIELELSLPDEPVWAHGDGTRLAQCIGNLLSNAQKFSDRGGRVRVALRSEGDAAVISVEDRGIGMDPGLIDRVFQPFTQADQSLDRSRGGLGLGLALVKGLVELHGGSVHAESPGKGRGSTLTLRLPKAAAPRATRREAAPAVAAEKRRIVIIEDNADAAESLSILLSMGGHDVTTAATGADGLRLVRAERPDVVICDIGLPGGITGYDVAREIRASRDQGGTYLIALTGYGRDDDRKRAADAGFDVHLTKPIEPTALELLIAEWTTKIDKQPGSGRLG